MFKREEEITPCHNNPIIQTIPQDVKEQKQELFSKLKMLSEKYRCTRRTIMLSRTVSSNVCERRIKHLLDNSELEKDNQRFDSYYRQKSEFATIKILEHMKSRLLCSGVDVTILTEAPSDIGRYDVILIQGYPCKIYVQGVEMIRVEVKASLGLDFEQIDRYLWDSSPLILARVITGHVAKLEPLVLQSYVLFSLRELNAKVDRLISGEIYTIPGIACRTCADRSCLYNRNKGKEPVNVVTMPDSEFAEDLNSFFKNLSYVAERTANLVIEELKGISPEQGIPVSNP